MALGIFFLLVLNNTAENATPGFIYMRGLLNRGIYSGISVIALILVDLCSVGRVCFVTHLFSELRYENA